MGPRGADQRAQRDRGRVREAKRRRRKADTETERAKRVLGRRKKESELGSRAIETKRASSQQEGEGLATQRTQGKLSGAMMESAVSTKRRRAKRHNDRPCQGRRIKEKKAIKGGANSRRKSRKKKRANNGTPSKEKKPEETKAMTLLGRASNGAPSDEKDGIPDEKKLDETEAMAVLEESKRKFRAEVKAKYKAETMAELERKRKLRAEAKYKAEPDEDEDDASVDSIYMVFGRSYSYPVGALKEEVTCQEDVDDDDEEQEQEDYGPWSPEERHQESLEWEREEAIEDEMVQADYPMDKEKDTRLEAETEEDSVYEDSMEDQDTQGMNEEAHEEVHGQRTKMASRAWILLMMVLLMMSLINYGRSWQRADGKQELREFGQDEPGPAVLRSHTPMAFQRSHRTMAFVRRHHQSEPPAPGKLLGGRRQPSGQKLTSEGGPGVNNANKDDKMEGPKQRRAMSNKKDGMKAGLQTDSSMNQSGPAVSSSALTGQLAKSNDNGLSKWKSKSGPTGEWKSEEQGSTETAPLATGKQGSVTPPLGNDTKHMEETRECSNPLGNDQAQITQGSITTPLVTQTESPTKPMAAKRTKQAAPKSMMQVTAEPKSDDARKQGSVTAPLVMQAIAKATVDAANQDMAMRRKQGSVAAPLATTQTAIRESGSRRRGHQRLGRCDVDRGSERSHKRAALRTLRH